MSDGFWKNMGGILVGIAALITALVAVIKLVGPASPNKPTSPTKPVASTNEPVTNPILAPKPPAKCEAPYVWNEDENECVRFDRIPQKRISVPLTARISNLSGRIDVYLNERRLPGTDNHGRAMYKADRGAVQMVIPVYKGTNDVSYHHWRDVVYRASNGNEVCSLDQSWPSTTGWLKKMRVKYSIDLPDCSSQGSPCSARLEPDGKHVSIKTKAIKVMIAEHCR